MRQENNKISREILRERYMNPFTNTVMNTGKREEKN